MTGGLAIAEEHGQLADVARSIVTSRVGTTGARRMLLDAEDTTRWWESDGLWKEVVSTGWLGMHIDERFGGQGFGLAELAIVVEQLGRAAIAGPFLPTAIAAAVIAELGDDDQRGRWLPHLTSGDLVAAIGNASRAERADNADNVVTVASCPTLGEMQSDLFLIPVGDDLALVESGPTTHTTRSATSDQVIRPVTIVTCTRAPVVEMFAGGAATLHRLTRLLCAAEATGGLTACTEMATSYAAGREQFGRPIGSFQAVKHHCANMLVDSELSAAVTWEALRAMAGSTEAELAATMAAGQALDAYVGVALRNIQIHGGIGYTWEHDAHLYLRRALVLSSFVGTPELLREQTAQWQLAGVRRDPAPDLPPEAEQFSDQVREFRAELANTEPGDRQKLYARSGYLTPHWPGPYGRSAGAVEQLVIDREMKGIDRPSLGLGEWVLPTILQHGTPEQLERLMQPSLEGDLRWCQLFSEPGAGSDAAAVSTKAVRADGGWSVSGQKVWTSDAVNCQRGLATVRTDTKVAKHKGITAMIIDLGAPGVEVRPLRELTGAAFFNEVFFDEVFVPDNDVVGEVNNGWRVAMATFGNERLSIGGGSVTMNADDALNVFARHRPGGTGYLRDVGALLIESYALTALNLRIAARAVQGGAGGVEGNVAKLFGSEHAQRIAELCLRMASPAILVGEEPEVMHDLLYSRCLTVAGGTSEIVRNLLAERILGLPREPMTR